MDNPAMSQLPAMSQRQAAFRAEFRTHIAPAYSGWVHVALIYALGRRHLVLRKTDLHTVLV